MVLLRDHTTFHQSIYLPIWAHPSRLSRSALLTSRVGHSLSIAPLTMYNTCANESPLPLSLLLLINHPPLTSINQTRALHLDNPTHPRNHHNNRRWKGGTIEPHPTEKALIVNYKLEAAVFSEPDDPMLEQKKVSGVPNLFNTAYFFCLPSVFYLGFCSHLVT